MTINCSSAYAQLQSKCTCSARLSMDSEGDVAMNSQVRGIGSLPASTYCGFALLIFASGCQIDVAFRPRTPKQPVSVADRGKPGVSSLTSQDFQTSRTSLRHQADQQQIGQKIASLKPIDPHETDVHARHRKESTDKTSKSVVVTSDGQSQRTLPVSSGSSVSPGT